ncbi:MAG: peptidoglycan-binding protein [Flavobacterium sp.]|nr:MAG: peptidoglycan-binding protein [Flavobacterium sp.]
MFRRTFLLLVLFTAFACKKNAPPAPMPKPIHTAAINNEGIVIDSLFVKRVADSTTAAFYRSNNFKSVWDNKKDREIVTLALSRADLDGLDPKDYSAKELFYLESRYAKLNQREIAEYDLKLTVNLAKFLRHMMQGKLNPRELYKNWDLPRKKIDINSIIAEAIVGDSLEQAIASARPKHFMYASLQQALRQIRTLPKDHFRPFDTDMRKLSCNDTSEIVLRIKKRLIYWKDLKKSDSLTNLYDHQMCNAVKRFQSRHGLASDGVIGKGTLEALNFTREKRREQIVANLERWRWFPRNFSNHYLIVNIPGYTLHVVKDGDTVMEKRIVVGKLERRTPVLTSTFSNIVFNPTWTVPPTIIREDLVPSASKNRNYFAEREIDIFDGKNNAVNPEAWNPAKPGNYRYVQRPGDNNSLGNVKFNFPNHYTVYLHDTNHRDFFARNRRSLSSGCVRVEDPLPLAEYMLDSKEWTLDKILEKIATKETTYVKVRNHINIYQLYWTAWSENGQFVFRDDIYALDGELYDRLRN